jgi:hypothetical protein
MPWTAKDADAHVKGLSAKQKRAWAQVANSALAQCQKDGGSNCDATAIRQANAAAQRVGESDDPGAFAGLSEAQTVKHRARALLRDIEALLADKGLSDDETAPLAALRDRLKAKWSDLTAPEPTAESLAAEAAAILAQDDSYDGRRCAVQMALYATTSRTGGMMGDGPYPWIRDLYDDVVVYQMGEDLFRRDYTINADETVTLGDPIEVEMSYVPVAAAAQESEAPEDAGTGAAVDATEEAKADPNVGGGTDRSKIPAADFAGKNRSFPIVSPKDVADAAASIGRAGSDNYSSDQLKRRIIAIAKRKGAAFTAQLPKAWQESEASHEVALEGDLIPLIEKAVKKDGTLKVKVIQAGWGSSGFYPADVLKRDGPRVFADGTQMFWNHQTAEEAAARPEGDLRDLAAVLTSDAEWQERGPAGPGLYASAKAIGGYAGAIESLAPHIGVSIRAYGRAKAGEAEGREGPIIEELTAGQSVDFVTAAGAGGEILQLFEAARGRTPAPTSEGRPTVDEEQARALREAMAGLEQRNTELTDQLARMQEALLIRDVRDMLGSALRELDMPDMTRQRLFESLQGRAPIKDGALDRDAYRTLIQESVKAELAYLAQATGLGDGRIRGMGATAAPSDAAAQESLAESLKRLGGFSDDLAKVAANGRVR